jgi:membrane protease YdiL (CAAX protease family)
MRAPIYEASLYEAKQYPQIWRLIVGLLLVFFIMLASIALIVVGVGLSAAATDGVFAVMPALMALMVWQTPGAVMLLLLTFVGMFLGPILAAAALHFRSIGSLLGPAGDWFRGFGLTLILTLGIGMLGFLVLHSVDPSVANLDLNSWLRWLPLGLLLLFVQTGAEEILFRGYLQQQLAARFAARWVWFGLPAVIFTLLHVNPEYGTATTLLILGFGILPFALFAADLGAPMGLHFANNFMALFVVSYEPDISGMALYVSTSPIEDPATLLPMLLLSFSSLSLIWWVSRRLLTR